MPYNATAKVTKIIKPDCIAISVANIALITEAKPLTPPMPMELIAGELSLIWLAPLKMASPYKTLVALSIE
jgi:hypothetical protein